MNFIKNIDYIFTCLKQFIQQQYVKIINTIHLNVIAEPHNRIGVSMDDDYNTIVALQKTSKHQYILKYCFAGTDCQLNNEICNNTNAINKLYSTQSFKEKTGKISYATAIGYNVIQNKLLLLPKNFANNHNHYNIQNFLTLNSLKLLNIQDFSQYYFDYLAYTDEKLGKQISNLCENNTQNLQKQHQHHLLLYINKNLLNNYVVKILHKFNIKQNFNIIDIDIYALMRGIIFCYPDLSNTAFISLNINRNVLCCAYVKHNHIFYIKTVPTDLEQSNNISFLLEQLQAFNHELLTQKLNNITTINQHNLPLLQVVLTGKLITKTLYQQLNLANSNFAFIFPDFTAKIALENSIKREELIQLCPSLMLSFGLALHKLHKVYSYV